ncbi:4-phosphoerythronate dehydrogenase [Marinobacter daqiaonensis]|uniref:Erythronate-4-phosphate dehydrogenase n=1 Tax=Marinobacter daqiaonensis TaxID=650891 RepID=A0A1I6H282_9GAMM|nr:4-phosphoerythronate dehydrogenase [Marinobacter daqiaonensis]SFR48605.1 4-phosphoerythronate dehydrogenase [Marinobacter daqiaonensis]
MHIVADENIPLLGAFVEGLGTVERANGRRLTRSQLMNADALLVRSVTSVNESLLAGTPVRFVGTATIGTDHVDIPWLERQGIAFASAPGCNASSVVQYVLGVISLYLRRCQREGFEGLTVGVVGAGNVGGALVGRLQALGARVRVSDPPRQSAGAGLPFASLEQVLACDVVSLHTPLTTTGECPTHHLLNSDRLASLGPNQLLINSGRGAVIDNRALLARLGGTQSPTVALDVWEHEPEPLTELLDHCWLATPHIAGYSLEGKCRGTEMVARALHLWLGRQLPLTTEELLPEPPVTAMAFAPDIEPVEAVHRALMACYDPRDDDARLRRAVDQASAGGLALGQAFDGLRRNYPVRREPGSLKIQSTPGSDGGRLLAAAGFQIS